MVAKSFATLPIVSNVFKEQGRNYVKVMLTNGTIKKVRWYTKEDKSVPTIEKVSAFDLEPIVNQITKDQLGFGEKGYITIFKGDTEATHDWFSYNGRYLKTLGWYFPENKEYTTLPINIEPIKLYWNEISENNIAFSEAKIKEIVDEKLYGKSDSNYIGKIGDRINTILTVCYVKNITTDYGMSYFHVLKDKNGNVCTWTTNVRKLNIGETYNITGTIKELKKFKNERQTVLTRCKIYEDY